MKSIILALIVFLGMAAALDRNCDVERAKLCQNKFMAALSDDGQNKMMLCTLHLKFKSCISLADCDNDSVFGPLRVEAIDDMNMLCNSGEAMMVASISTMLLALLAMFFK